MNYLVTSYSYIYVTCMITKVTQTCIALWFIFFVPPVSHESMRMAWFLFGPKCRVWCLFGGAQSIKHKPPVKTQDLCKFSLQVTRIVQQPNCRTVPVVDFLDLIHPAWSASTQSSNEVNCF